MTVEKAPSACPDHETLSAWFDGECDLSSAQKEHIRTCVGCQDFLRLCRAIGPAVTRSADEVYSKESEERILTGTRRMIVRQMKPASQLPPKQPARWYTSPPWLLRFAALFCLAAVLIYLLFLQSAVVSSDKPEYRATVASSSGRTAMASLLPLPSSYVSYRVPAAFTYSGNPLEAGTPGERFAVYDDLPGSGCRSFLLAAPGFIRRNVEQLWTSSSFSHDELKKHLKTLIDELHVVCRQEYASGEFICDFELNARQAALLAKQLNAWGMRLQSEASPRPDQNFFLGDGSERISYRIRVTFAPSAGAGFRLPVD